MSKKCNELFKNWRIKSLEKFRFIPRKSINSEIANHRMSNVHSIFEKLPSVSRHYSWKIRILICISLDTSSDHFALFLSIFAVLLLLHPYRKICVICSSQESVICVFYERYGTTSKRIKSLCELNCMKKEKKRQTSMVSSALSLRHSKS